MLATLQTNIVRTLRSGGVSASFSEVCNGMPRFANMSFVGKGDTFVFGGITDCQSLTPRASAGTNGAASVAIGTKLAEYLGSHRCEPQAARVWLRDLRQLSARGAAPSFATPAYLVVLEAIVSAQRHEGGHSVATLPSARSVEMYALLADKELLAEQWRSKEDCDGCGASWFTASRAGDGLFDVNVHNIGHCRSFLVRKELLDVASGAVPCDDRLDVSTRLLPGSFRAYFQAFRNRTVRPMSRDQHPLVDVEYARVGKAGKHLLPPPNTCVLGGTPPITVSRAFGFPRYKMAASLPPFSQAVVAVPEHRAVRAAPGDLLLIANRACFEGGGDEESVLESTRYSIDDAVDALLVAKAEQPAATTADLARALSGFGLQGGTSRSIHTAVVCFGDAADVDAYDTAVTVGPIFPRVRDGAFRRAQEADWYRCGLSPEEALAKRLDELRAFRGRAAASAAVPYPALEAAVAGSFRDEASFFDSCEAPDAQRFSALARQLRTQ